MSGLVSYGSSDEEEAPPKVGDPARAANAAEAVVKLRKSLNGGNSGTKPNGVAVPVQNTSHETEAPMVGPPLGPSELPVAYMESPSNIEDEAISMSPVSANRARLRQLTLPPLPYLEIPDSPPGSPPPSTNSKFAHFLELKKKGTHFNERLANSSALKNPSMMQKLMDFANVDDADQYCTTLPKELWDPQGFPDWAHKEDLASSQQKLLKKKDEKAKGQRDSVDFVPATASGDSSRSGTPGANVGGRIGPKSAAERVMAGLDRGRSTSPAIQTGMKRKTRFES